MLSPKSFLKVVRILKFLAKRSTLCHLKHDDHREIADKLEQKFFPDHGVA